jgi:hypothetical protein
MKVFKTKKENAVEVKNLKFMKKILTKGLVGLKGDERKFIKSEIEKINRALEFTLSTKRFLYNFKSGGWNSASGVTLDEAYRGEVKRWGSTYNMDRASFRLCTDSEEKSLMSLFY